MASTYDRYPSLGDCVHISAYIKDRRRIVDLLQLCGVGGIIQTDDGNTGRGHMSQFVTGQFHRLAGAERLSRYGLNAGGLEFSQRSFEDVLHTAEMFDEPPRSGRTQARGQGKGQPLQGEAFAGSGAQGEGFGRFTTSTSSDSRTSYIRRKRCQGHTTHCSVKIKHRPHETPSYFRDFLP
jgi:hypothetical protein